MDLHKYEPVIKRTLGQRKVSRKNWDDSWQECCLALLEHQEELSAEEDPLVLGYKICFNRIRCLQTQARKHQTPESLSLPWNRQEADRIQGQAENKSLIETINTLPREQAEVLSRLYIEGDTQEEAAEILGITRDAVRHRHKIGIAALKKYFGAE